MESTFAKALKQLDITTVQACPKSDLHNHCYLGGNRAYLEKWSGRAIPHLCHPLTSMDEMHQWVDKHIAPLLPDNAVGREKAIEAAFVQASHDGVTLLDFGDDVWAQYYYDDSPTLMCEAMKRLHREFAPAIEFRPQLGISRHCPVDAILKWFEPFLELGYYKSVDLYGDEMSQPIQNFIPIYREAKAAGLTLKAHVGEWGDAESVRKAVEVLDLNEVQHGIAAANSKDIMHWLADRNVQLNICPTSNIMLGRVQDYKTHPMRVLYDHGIRVTVNTDDVLVFGQGVSEEFLNLYKAGLFSAKELDEIRLIGLNTYSHKGNPKQTI